MEHTHTHIHYIQPACHTCEDAHARFSYLWPPHRYNNDTRRKDDREHTQKNRSHACLEWHRASDAPQRSFPEYNGRVCRQWLFGQLYWNEMQILSFFSTAIRTTFVTPRAPLVRNLVSSQQQQHQPQNVCRIFSFASILPMVFIKEFFVFAPKVRASWCVNAVFFFRVGANVRTHAHIVLVIQFGQMTSGSGRTRRSSHPTRFAVRMCCASEMCAQRRRSAKSQQ